MRDEYYASAGFPSGEIKCAVFDTRREAEKQAQKYADQGATGTSVRKEHTHDWKVSSEYDCVVRRCECGEKERIR